MNGEGLPTVGRLLGHRRRSTTAIYAHLDDATLQNAAVQAASVIAEAMEFSAEWKPCREQIELGSRVAPIGYSDRPACPPSEP